MFPDGLGSCQERPLALTKNDTGAAEVAQGNYGDMQALCYTGTTTVFPLREGFSAMHMQQLENVNLAS